MADPGSWSASSPTRHSALDLPAAAKVKVHADGTLNLIREPGSITIEAIAEGAVEGQDAGAPGCRGSRWWLTPAGRRRVAGWRNPVIVDLAGLAIPSQNRPIRFSHDMQSGVGHTDAIKIDTGRLLAAGIVSRDTAAAREIVARPATVFRGRPRSGPASRSTSSSRAAKGVGQWPGVFGAGERGSPVRLGEISFVD